MFLFKKKNKDLFEYHLEIRGMRCGMCESHINDAIRKNFDIVSVKSNRFKNETVILSKKELDVEKIKEVINGTGYELKNIKVGND